AQARDVPASDVLEEVGRLVERHFYDPSAVDDDWRGRLDDAAASLGEEADEAELATAVAEVLGALGASHTRRYTRDQAAYYELLGIFSRSREVRRRLDDIFEDG